MDGDGDWGGGDGRATCPDCGGPVRARRIATAFPRGRGFALVRDIPAVICEGCGEEFLSDRTAIALDRMKGEGFGVAAEVIAVPVYPFRDGAG